MPQGLHLGPNTPYCAVHQVPLGLGMGRLPVEWGEEVRRGRRVGRKGRGVKETVQGMGTALSAPLEDDSPCNWRLGGPRRIQSLVDYCTVRSTVRQDLRPVYGGARFPMTLRTVLLSLATRTYTTCTR